MTRVLLLVFFLLLSLATPAAADIVRGRLTDPSGRPVPQAQVLIISGGAVVAIATTDRDGRFGPITLPAGEYEVSASANGLRLKPQRITVAATGVAEVNAALELSAVREAVVVSAAQVDRPLSRVTDSVTVIDRTEIERAQIDTAADALRRVPGFGVVQSGTRGAITSFFPRGGESDYTQVFVDGMPINFFGGGFDAAHLSVSGLERIEVVRGPQSALFGGGAIGGVINLVTRKGGAPHASATFEGGAYGTTRVAAETSGGRGAWSWGAAIERMASDGVTSFRSSVGGNVTNDDYERIAGSAGVSWSDRATRRVRADVRFDRNDRGNPGPFGSDPLDRYSEISISRGENRPRGVSASALFGDPRRLRHSVQASWMDMPATFTTAFGTSEDRSRRTTARYQADVERGALGLSSGLEVVKERADNTFVTNANFEGIPVNRTLAGFFAEGRYDASSRAGLTLGMRVERIERGALAPDAFGSRPPLDEDVVWSFNPKVSAVWFLRGDRASSAADGWTKIRGGAGTGIKPPTVFELGFTDNPSLKPERSRSFDLGLEHAIGGQPLVIDTTAFFNSYDDLIVSVGANIADASAFQSDNVANARAAGLETGVRWIGPGGLSVRASYTYLRTRVLAVDDVADGAPNPFEVGDWLIRRPRHAFSIDADVSRGPVTAFVQVNGRGRFLDVEPNFGAPTFFAEGYEVVALGGAYRLGRQLELFARVTNIFDREYEEALGYPSLGRAAMAGLRVAVGR